MNTSTITCIDGIRAESLAILLAMEAEATLDSSEIELLNKINQQLKEIKSNCFESIPEDKLTQIYELIPYFRLGLNVESQEARTPGLLKGKLRGAFFDPLPEEELQQWEIDI